MLRVTIEIVPYGDETRTRLIGVAEIGLQQVRDGNIGDYHVYTYKEDGELTGAFEIRGHPRDTGAWELVRLVVNTYTRLDQANTLRAEP